MAKVLTTVALLIALAASLPSPVGSAANGAIVGQVALRPSTLTPDRPGVAQLGAKVTPQPQPAPAVVYLETAPRNASDRRHPLRAVMDQRNEAFVPRVLAITTGTTVDFPNSDLIYHNVFSLSRPARFDLGRYAVGRSKSVRFNRPGVVRVFCDIHSHMSAYILVFDHPFFAVADADGRYRIDDVPPGTYAVAAWQHGESTAARSVTVPDGGDTEIDFSLQ
ncbi:MAG: carboxypeptidase regulatory-like domain-containing protein [Vicinamibacterales bacterium]